MNKKNIAIVLAKEDLPSFNRYLIPVVGRPVAIYPLLAAKHSGLVDEICLLSDSSSLIEQLKAWDGIKILERSGSRQSIAGEMIEAIEVESRAGQYTPNNIVLLFANSPCVVASEIENALRILEEKPDIDSVVSAMKRSEFEPSKMFGVSSDGLLYQMQPRYSGNVDIFFLDRRFVVVRWDVLRQISGESEIIESILGTRIYPVMQNEGVWDIDYPWQIPAVDRWLRQNGFTDEKTPYDRNERTIISPHQPQRKNDRLIKVLVSTVPFGQHDRTPLDLLENTPETSYQINPLGRKFKEDEIAEYIGNFDILIAGTEKISKKVLSRAKNLKLISRVGIGLDSVDLEEARRLCIKVSYTPEAPSPAVAELTIAHMLNLLRKLPIIDRRMRSGVWQRIMGERLANQVVGIVGTGRIGRRVLKLLHGFHPKSILVNDLRPDPDFYRLYDAESVDKETIFRNCDVITFHVPLTVRTRNLVTLQEMQLMKSHCLLINTSRGGIINEGDLFSALAGQIIGGAAIDVFEEEPYSGRLIELDNCLISCHSGSMTEDCRREMEVLATQEVVRYVRHERLLSEVPEEEYINASGVH